MKPLETTIRHHLTDFLANEESFADFTSWMYLTIWNIDQHGDLGASDLGYSIMMALAEYDSGILTFSEFRDDLQALAQPIQVQWSDGSVRMSVLKTQSSASTVSGSLKAHLQNPLGLRPRRLQNATQRQLVMGFA